VDFLDGEKKGM